ncbi:hypothetical protein ACGF4C_14565 [Streptomyces sp. NPDC048197]
MTSDQSAPLQPGGTASEQLLKKVHYDDHLPNPRVSPPRGCHGD